MQHKSEKMMESIIEFAENYYFTHRHSPSTSAIAEGVGSSKGTVHRYLTEMNTKGMIKYDGKTIMTDRLEKANLETVTAGLIGSVSCGSPQLEEEFIDEYVSLPASMFGKGTFFILRANGESMVNAGINDGDLVVVRKTTEAKDGEIVVALIENETTLKRLYRDEKKHCIILHPENDSMSDIIVPTCLIQGVAVNVIKELH